MNSVSRKAYAKINLTLDVLGKFDNGYHDLKMIMQQISMYDSITVSKCERNGIFLNCNKNITQIKDNIVYKACELMKNRFNIEEGIEVYLEKNIFLSAGLAGGSTDCATTLICINELFNIGLSIQELMEIGGELGKDVVFCIQGGLALATGDGTELEKLNGFSKTYMLVANPNFEVSTKFVFENFVFSGKKESDYKTILNAIESDDIEEISSCFNNVLETVTIKEYPILEEMKKCMLNNGALNSIMTGSGATVFGFFENEECAIKAENEFKKTFPEYLVNVCHTVG